PVWSVKPYRLPCHTDEFSDNAVFFACFAAREPLAPALDPQHSVLVQLAVRLCPGQIAADPGTADLSHPRPDPHRRKLDALQQWLGAPGRSYGVGCPGP